jgi:hypothetical protein
LRLPCENQNASCSIRACDCDRITVFFGAESSGSLAVHRVHSGRHRRSRDFTIGLPARARGGAKGAIPERLKWRIVDPWVGGDIQKRRTMMNEKFRTISIATVTLLSATGLAIAGGASKSSQQSDTSSSMQQSGMSGSTSSGKSTGASGSSSASTQNEFTKDKITLTNEQKRMVFQQLAMDARVQKAPASFQASVGATLPSDIQLEEVPNDVSTEVPTVANYRFAKVEADQLLIVDPNDRRVVSVIEQQEIQQGQKKQQ